MITTTGTGTDGDSDGRTRGESLLRPIGIARSSKQLGYLDYQNTNENNEIDLSPFRVLAQYIRLSRLTIVQDRT